MGESTLAISAQMAAAEHVIEIQSAEQHQNLVKDSRRLVVFYGADWCTGCDQITKFFVELSAKYHKRLTFAHADIDKAKLDFERVPAFIAFRKGEELNGFEGSDPNSLKILTKEVILAD